jgi:hypothetical protein
MYYPSLRARASLIHVVVAMGCGAGVGDDMLPNAAGLGLVGLVGQPFATHTHKMQPPADMSA